jgi:hypothetical protein
VRALAGDSTITSRLLEPGLRGAAVAVEEVRAGALDVARVVAPRFFALDEAALTVRVVIGSGAARVRVFGLVSSVICSHLHLRVRVR